MPTSTRARTTDEAQSPLESVGRLWQWGPRDDVGIVPYGEEFT